MDPITAAASAWVIGRVGAESIKQFGTLLGQIAGPSADEIGQHYAERVRAWRLENLGRIGSATAEKLHERGIEPSEVPARILYPMLDALSKCDDASLGEMWASLLATAATNRGSDELLLTFTAILSEMSPFEARVVSRLATVPKVHSDARSIRRDQFCAEFGLSIQDFEMLYGRLLRHQIIESNIVLTMRGGYTNLSPESLELSPLGVAFTAACEAASSGEP